MNHEGQVVLVTGGGAGIGSGICEAFAKAGATISVADIDASAAKHTANQITARGDRAIAIAGDVSIASDAERMIKDSVEALEGLDVLVNNAGIQPTSSYMTAEQMDEATWDRIIDVNLNGQLRANS